MLAIALNDLSIKLFSAN